ncbi:MAG: hypothetical protein HY735_01390 [Verrucomicrobia bacterium]|nr:hypothetical protein [Verrucomicrobiota bacterium]
MEKRSLSSLQKTELDMRAMSLLGCHPDGKQIFLHKRGISVSEIWVMENFLPPVAAAK